MTLTNSRFLIAATLAAGLGGAAAEHDPRTLAAPRFRYDGPTPSGGGRRWRRRSNKWLEEARAATAAHKGNPPGYTFAHHDRLVRLCGRRAADDLERRVLAREITFARAVELAVRP